MSFDQQQQNMFEIYTSANYATKIEIRHTPSFRADGETGKFWVRDILMTNETGEKYEVRKKLFLFVRPMRDWSF